MIPRTVVEIIGGCAEGTFAALKVRLVLSARFES